MSSYVFKTLIYIDMLIASLIWADADITISAYTGLALRKSQPPWWAIVLGRWFLNRIQKNHCELAIAGDTQRAKNALTILEG